MAAAFAMSTLFYLNLQAQLNIRLFIVHLITQVIDSVLHVFEQLLFGSWSQIFFGYGDDGDLHLFPAPTSPLFWVWMTLITCGVLFMGISMISTSMNRIKGIEGETRMPVVVSKKIGIMFAVLLIPFTLMTGLNVVTTLSQITFNTLDNEEKVDYSVFQTTYADLVDELAEDNESFTSSIVLDNSTTNTLTGIYSHESSEWSDDVTNDSQFTYDELQDVFLRIQYELNIFYTEASDKLTTVQVETIEYLMSMIETHITTWTGSASNFNEMLSVLSDHARNVREGGEDSEAVLELQEILLLMNEWISSVDETLTNITTFLASVDTYLLNFPSDTNSETLMKNSIGDIDARVNQIDPSFIDNITTIGDANKMHVYASLYNIKQLSWQYIVPSEYYDGGILDYSIVNTPVSSDIDQSMTKYLLQAFELTLWSHKDSYNVPILMEAYSIIKSTILSDIVEDVMGGSYWELVGKGVSLLWYPEAMAKAYLAMMVGMAIVGLLGQMLTVLVKRIVKMIWLWFMGTAFLSANSEDSQKIRIWGSMVFIEMMTIFAFAMIWMIWTHTTPLILQSYSVGENWLGTGKTIVDAMIVLSTLEIVIMSLSWVSSFLGGGDGVGQAKQVLSGNAQKTTRGVKRNQENRDIAAKGNAKVKTGFGKGAGMVKSGAIKTGGFLKGLKKGGK